MKKRFRVALVVETTGIYGRQILFGISRYLNIHNDWQLFVDERQEMAPPPKWLLDWDGDGIICRATTPILARALKKRNIAVVDLNDKHGFLGLPHISSDMQAIGRLAAEHMLERGLRKIAYAGFSDQAWSKARLEGVREALSVRGQLCGVFESSSHGYRAREWHSEVEQLRGWIASLPRPLGIVACNDRRAQHVLEVCRMMDLAVPDEVAVVGVDNTKTLCELSYPPLSSVIPDSDRIGFEAASLLSRLMRGETGEIRMVIPPRGVVSRQSSEVWATNDPIFAKAIRFMREHACDGISVNDVMAHAHISRSTLERRIREHLGHSPQQELRMIRLKRVKQLLEETELTLDRIAAITGFEHPEFMMAQFKQLTGQTPSQWRDAHRA